MTSVDRRLAAIMFTDVVGYTRMAQANEQLALELLEEHRRVIRPLLAKHGGAEVKTIGDAFLVEFRSALEAVLCGVEIQQKMSEHNSQVPKERKVEVRVGIHLGDVVHESGDVYGDAVNVASRIEPLAEPGGLWISQQVFDNIRNKTKLEIVRLGEVELKNVELPVSVYKVTMSTGTPIATGRKTPRERLAVLPFVNISPDPNDEYFADGLTEELISKLSEVKGLKVIARTSVMNYKKKEKSVSQIGKELEAGSIIEGSVRKAGSKIRVTVQLIDSGTEEHLWATNYDKELDDIFAIQTDIATRVAGSVSAGLLPSTKHPDTEDVEAYTLYIRAMQRFHEGVEGPLRESVALFNKAISRDTGFARAHAGLSLALTRLAVMGYEDYGVLARQAEPEALKALELDSGSAEAHAAMASVCNALDKSDQVEAEAGKAVSLNPNLAEAHLALGISRAALGRLEEGLASMERALELDPLSLHTGDLVARTARVLGRNDRSLAVLERLNQLNPMNPIVLNGFAEGYMMAQNFTKAQELLSLGLEVNPREPLLRLNQGILYALTGRKEEAEKELRWLKSERGEAVVLYGKLFINAALGNLDDAFSALMRAAELHSWPFLIGSLPVFTELRKDPRYREFAVKVGILA
jgi:adenylate cyclase